MENPEIQETPQEIKELLESDVMLYLTPLMKYVVDVRDGKREADLHTFVKNMLLAAELMAEIHNPIVKIMVDEIDMLRQMVMRHPEKVQTVAKIYLMIPKEPEEAELLAQDMGETLVGIPGVLLEA